MNHKFCYNLDNENMLREVIVKIGLERIDMQEEVIVEVSDMQDLNTSFFL